ncbi:hypothetical protein ACWCXB_02245 [Streptomyces sp. NPDC001514]
MTEYDEIGTLLDGTEYEEFEERTPYRRPAVRTPSRRSSYSPRHTPAPASQGQVQSTARNLDSKIETLAAAVKSLESRTNTLATDQGKLVATLRKEAGEQKKSSDVIRTDLQQTKLLALLLPMLTQETVDADADGKAVKVVTRSQSQMADLLPFLLLMPGLSGGSGNPHSGGLGGDMVTNLLLLSMLTKK